MTIDDYMTIPYAITIETDEAGGQLCYVAYNPELPGCMAQGNTPQEAVDNLKEARRDYITAVLEHGLTVPIPADFEPYPHVFQAQKVPDVVSPLFTVKERVAA